jgi:hypothetical protein
MFKSATMQNCKVYIHHENEASNLQGLITKILAKLEKWQMKFYEDNQFGLFFQKIPSN